MKETKVYVDELPKSCWECPCFKNDLEFPCGLSDGTQDYFKDEIDGENCPLKSIKAHDRELVKEVCEKIKQDCWCGGAILEDDYYRVPVKYLQNLQKEFEK